MTDQEIRAEITQGPLAAVLAPLIAAGRDADVAAALNDATRGEALARPMRVGDFANWLAGRGLLRKVGDARTHANDVIASISLLLTLIIQGDPARMVDPRDAGIQGMFGAYIQAGIVTPTDMAAFVTACTGPAARAEVKWGDGVRVSADDVSRAMLPTRGG